MVKKRSNPTQNRHRGDKNSQSKRKSDGENIGGRPKRDIWGAWRFQKMLEWIKNEYGLSIGQIAANMAILNFNIPLGTKPRKKKRKGKEDRASIFRTWLIDIEKGRKAGLSDPSRMLYLAGALNMAYYEWSDFTGSWEDHSQASKDTLFKLTAKLHALITSDFTINKPNSSIAEHFKFVGANYIPRLQVVDAPYMFPNEALDVLDVGDIAIDISEIMAASGSDDTISRFFDPDIYETMLLDLQNEVTKIEKLSFTETISTYTHLLRYRLSNLVKPLDPSYIDRAVALVMAWHSWKKPRTTEFRYH